MTTSRRGNTAFILGNALEIPFWPLNVFLHKARAVRHLIVSIGQHSEKACLNKSSQNIWFGWCRNFMTGNLENHWNVRSKQKKIQHHWWPAKRLCLDPSSLFHRVTLCHAEMEIENWWPWLWFSFVEWDAASHRFTLCGCHLIFCKISYGSGKTVG